MNKKISIVSAVIAIVIVATLSFYGGTAYSSSKRVSFGQGGQFGAGGNFGAQGTGVGRRAGMAGTAGGGMVFGEILSKDSQSITIKLPNGGSQIVLVSSSTTVGKVATGTSEDLVVGGNVTVSGSSNSDGSITAQTVQIRPTGLNTRQAGK